jgi:hypothetical protein
MSLTPTSTADDVAKMVRAMLDPFGTIANGDDLKQLLLWVFKLPASDLSSVPAVATAAVSSFCEARGLPLSPHSGVSLTTGVDCFGTGLDASHRRLIYKHLVAAVSEPGALRDIDKELLVSFRPRLSGLRLSDSDMALPSFVAGAEQMQQNVLYVVNELSADQAERRAKHEPLKLKGPRGRAAAGGADGKTRRRDRVVQTAASVSLAAELVAARCRRVYQDVARVSPTEGIKSTEQTLRDKYDADVAASNKRKQPEVPVDFEKLAQAAGSVSAVGGSITSVKLSKLSIEFVRGIMERFSLAGMESVSQMKELKKSGALSTALTDAKLRERLEDELRKLFSSTEESDRKLFDQLKSELQTERTRDKNGRKKKAKSAD